MHKKNTDELDLNLQDDDSQFINDDLDMPIVRKTNRVSTFFSKVPKAPEKIETRLPIHLLLEEGSTQLKNLNVFSELPLASITVENVRKRYVISETVNNNYQRNITVTLLPPTQGFGGLENTGLPTINDTDIIKFCVSLLQRKCLKENIQLTEESRTVSFFFRDFANFTGCGTGGSNLAEFRASLIRLKGSVIEISSDWVSTPPSQTMARQSMYNMGQFSFIEDFQILSDSPLAKMSPKAPIYVTVTLGRMIWKNFLDPRNLINYNRSFFKLSSFKKGLYEKVVKSMGKKPMYRISLLKLATRMGAVDGALLDELDDENYSFDPQRDAETEVRYKLNKRKLSRILSLFKKSMRDAIADDDLLEFRIAIERKPRKAGQEVFVFYRRDYRHRLSNQINAQTGGRITQLELMLQRLHLVTWFKSELIHSKEMRDLLKEDVRWSKHHQYDVEAMAIGEGNLKKKWRRGQENRYQLLKHLRDIEDGVFISADDEYDADEDF